MVAAACAEVIEEHFCPIGVEASLLGNDIEERRVDILCHPLAISTNVDMRTILNPLVQLQCGDARVDAGFRPRTASEDFAFMLLKRPGSYVFVGNGDGASLHSPYYDFNDAILAPSATYWVRLAERFLA